MCRSRPTGCSDEVATFTIGLVRRPPAVVVTEESPVNRPVPTARPIADLFGTNGKA